MLIARWQQLMTSFGLHENKATYQSLMSAYAEGHRKYHDVSHLQAVLSCLDKVEFLAHRKAEIELALWFHDAIYEPFSASNESDSAEWARDFLKKNHVSEPVQEKVSELIMATSHAHTPNSDDEKLIVDIDLEILGQPVEIYRKYQSGVRIEYEKVPMTVYAKKRAEVLNGFLNRERLYFYDYFYEAYDGRARINLCRELKYIQGDE
ncbi:MAG: hypothetical protein H7A01_04805 [Hahellaceae bacterium]|nr:hypothetical protein [Hahellaceae bacterium]MCP5212738.1 hypothetical protein [Hahellaceae bacterium]